MDPTIEKVKALVEKIQEKIKQLWEAIKSALSKIPGYLAWIRDRVVDGWNYFTKKMNEAWVWLLDKLAYAGDPIALRKAALQWTTIVGSSAGKAADTLTAGQMAVDDEWEGDGADQYRQKLPDQRSALDSIKTDYAAMSSAGLDTAQHGITVFWGAVVVALAGLVGGIVGAAATSATIFGLPAAPFVAGAGVAVFLAAGVAGVHALTANMSSARLKFESAASFGVSAWPSFAMP
ncbi:MAG: hypothetical protein LBT54_04125 [Bifidobacteriaceae bacterium]|jgi:hypothetical protein|nr:hypothetical protein [Bifidobacteriaceae bacterium]